MKNWDAILFSDPNQEMNRVLQQTHQFNFRQGVKNSSICVL